MQKKTILKLLVAAVACAPVVGFAQDKQATYITAEDVKTVNATPGVDRTIQVWDLGHEHFSVGIIHRGPTGGAARGAAAPAAAGAARGNAPAAPAAQPCGQASSTPPPAGSPSGIAHDLQTEGYYITSGSGTMITGGHIVNGRQSAPNAEVTTTLNGPSCSGVIAGDVVTRDVKVGDIIIIPAGVPHGWSKIDDHVDYLSFRPSQSALTPGYIHPSLKK
jgi:mannose-6-phosphate isomerase-like protein (cupin superfamily)